MVLTKIYEEGHADLLTCHLFLEAWGRGMSPIAGENLRTISSVFRDGGMSWYADPQEQTRIAKLLLDRMLREGYFEVVDRQTRFHLGVMERLCEKLEKTDYASLSDKGLAALYSDYATKVVELNSWGMLVTLLEMGQTSVITEATYAYLFQKAVERNALEKVPEALSDLCAPAEGTYLREKREEEVRLAIRAKSEGIDSPSVREGLRDLHLRFNWVSYGYVGPALGVDHFESNVRELAAQENLENVLAGVENEEKNVQKRHRELEDQFGFDPEGLRLFTLARTFMFQKEYRKQILYRSFHALERFRKEVSKRSGLPLSDLGFLLPQEIPDALNALVDASTLRQRKALCVDLPYENRLLTGPDAQAFVENLEGTQPTLDRDELTGQCAYAAFPVRGKARLVFTAHDLEKLAPGDILVSPATSPVMVPGMRIAGAIVTDQGGLTCHAAIVSREMKKPCVIGTKIATRSLKDGDLIEVDSMKGTVRKIR